jgi:hypothetical protein
MGGKNQASVGELPGSSAFQAYRYDYNLFMLVMAALKAWLTLIFFVG